MSRKKVISFALLIGSMIVLAAGAFTLLSGHSKMGIGLLVLGIVIIAVGLAILFTHSSTAARQPS